MSNCIPPFDEHFPFGPRPEDIPPQGYGWFGNLPGGPFYPGWVPHQYWGNGRSRRLVWARDAEELTGDRYYNAWDNKRIGIHPCPRTNQDVITIYYKKKPKEVLYMDDELQVKDKFIPILKYAVCMKLAMSGSNPDIDLYNVFAQEYNALLLEARRDKDSDQPYYEHVKDNERPRDYFRRRRYGNGLGWRGCRW